MDVEVKLAPFGSLQRLFLVVFGVVSVGKFNQIGLKCLFREIFDEKA